MARTILGIAAGVILAFLTIALVEFAGTLIFPHVTAAGQAPDDRVASIPLGAKLLVVAGWFAGALLGALVTARIARRRPLGWAPPILAVVGGIANITMIPHPLWMSVAAILAPIAGGWIGTRLSGHRGAP